MNLVYPEVFLIGETRIIPSEMDRFLKTIGVPEWTTAAESESEVIIETAGKLCYMSFSTELNKNLTKVGTRDNFQYIQDGLIKTGHGSVLEHTSVNLMFVNVSRVMTHELIRHRAGAAYSMTSDRYVRPKELKFWIPSIIQKDKVLCELFKKAVLEQEQIYEQMEIASGIDKMTDPKDFSKKKELTSAFRRIIGTGQATNICATYNHRALRHIIEARTSIYAEEEIRLVFNKVFEVISKRYPSIYADAILNSVGDYFEISFSNSKI